MHRPVGRADPPPALEITVRRAPERANVCLTGEVDMVTAAQLADALSRVLDHGCRTVEVDLSGVGFMSAAGLRVLVEADRHARRRRARLLLTRPTPACARLFTLTGLDATLTIR
jgi:anti-sigma B factor antagonist